MSSKKAFGVTVLFLAIITALLLGVKYCNTETTDKLLYCPDEITCYVNDFTYTVEQDDCQAVFDLVMSAVAFDEQKIQLCGSGQDRIEGYIYDGGISFELNFNKIQRLEKEIENESLILSENFIFDSIKFTLWPELHEPQIIMQYFLNGKCHMFDEESSALCIKCDINYPALNKALAKKLIGLVPHTAGDMTPLASSVFPAKPDSIMLYVEGRAVEVTGAEKEAVYAIVSDVFAGTTVYNTRDYAEFSALEKLQGRVMLELRYARVQQYVPDGTTDETKVSGAYAGTVYQSLLLSWGVEEQHLYPFPCNTDFHVAINTDGVYNWTENYYTHHTYQPQLTPLYAYVRLRVYL
ncbi:MAG: hypothetical protein E7639_06345 [Ruminococcaceae bacterium]|nr:hypothetical protein [Oscillospiraceae bacterium]